MDKLDAHLYQQKISPVLAPATINNAALRLNYTNAKNCSENVASLRDLFQQLTPLIELGFFSATNTTISVSSVDQQTLEIQLEGKGIPRSLIVVALRILISTNDNDPTDYFQLLAALGHDEELAQQIYGGVNFDSDVDRIEISCTGYGASTPFQFMLFDEKNEKVLEEQRLVLPGWAQFMPDAQLEDSVLRLSAMRAFVPLGFQATHTLGEEEYFTRGDDLIFDNLSIEESCLNALYSVLESAGRS